jgi:hypothetical protein
MPIAKIIPIRQPLRLEPVRNVQTLADLMAPDREADEKLLRVIQGFEDRGVVVAFEGDASTREGEERDVIPGAGSSVAAASSPNNFVSEYLTRPLRTEQQAREDRAKLHPVFADVFASFGMKGR